MPKHCWTIQKIMIYWLLYAETVLKSFSHWGALILYFSTKQLCDEEAYLAMVSVSRSCFHFKIPFLVSFNERYRFGFWAFWDKNLTKFGNFPLCNILFRQGINVKNGVEKIAIAKHVYKYNYMQFHKHKEGGTCFGYLRHHNLPMPYRKRNARSPSKSKDKYREGICVV